MGSRSRSGSPEGGGPAAKVLKDVADSFSPLSPKQRGKGDQGDGQGGQGGNQDDAIRRYTTGSEALNRYLRTTDKSKYSKADREKFDKEAADVSAALEKYPPVPGKSWRGAPAGDWLDKTKKDGLFSDPAFMSTSTSEGAASRFKSIATGAFSGNKSDGVMISIDGKNGRDISGGSSLAHQKEVLFDQGTLFKVKDKRKEDDTTYLDLEELT